MLDRDEPDSAALRAVMPLPGVKRNHRINRARLSYRCGSHRKWRRRTPVLVLPRSVPRFVTCVSVSLRICRHGPAPSMQQAGQQYSNMNAYT